MVKKRDNIAFFPIIPAFLPDIDRSGQGKDAVVCSFCPIMHLIGQSSIFTRCLSDAFDDDSLSNFNLDVAGDTNVGSGPYCVYYTKRFAQPPRRCGQLLRNDGLRQLPQSLGDLIGPLWPPPLYWLTSGMLLLSPPAPSAPAPAVVP